MTTIHYERAGGFELPRDHEVLDIDTPGAGTGAFTLWRSVGWTTHPATPVGRFSGLLDSAQNALLQDEAAAAERAGTVLIPIPPDSPIETIVVGQAQAMMGVHTDAGGVWGVLTAHLRQLLVALTQSPQAALALVLAPDGRAARLAHQGEQSIADRPERVEYPRLLVGRAHAGPRVGRPGRHHRAARSPDRVRRDVLRTAVQPRIRPDLPASRHRARGTGDL